MGEIVKEEPTFAICSKCRKAFLVPPNYSDLEWLKCFTLHLGECGDANWSTRDDDRH
jgi:hypothetical protein